MARELVLFNHDGATDEFMSLALLVTMEDVDLLGVVVTPADCLGVPACEVSRKLLDLMRQRKTEVVLSEVCGPNPFPWIYRQYCMMINLLPVLNPRPKKKEPTFRRDGARFIVEQLEKASEPVTVLVTCPFTTLADALDINPEIDQKIRRIIWMGGALLDAPINPTTTGNVDPGIAPGANPNAEWNAYWDPPAVRRVLFGTRSDLEIVMFPLNVTNKAILQPDQVLMFAQGSKRYPLYDLAGNSYAQVAFEAGYSFWDTLTTAYIAHPKWFNKSRVLPLDIYTEGSDEGTMYLDEEGGRKVKVVLDIGPRQLDKFYDYILKQWKWKPPRRKKRKR